MTYVWTCLPRFRMFNAPTTNNNDLHTHITYMDISPWRGICPISSGPPFRFHFFVISLVHTHLDPCHLQTSTSNSLGPASPVSRKSLFEAYQVFTECPSYANLALINLLVAPKLSSCTCLSAKFPVESLLLFNRHPWVFTWGVLIWKSSFFIAGLSYVNWDIIYTLVKWTLVLIYHLNSRLSNHSYLVKFSYISIKKI